MANGLFQAVKTGRYRQVRYLVENGLSVNSQNPEGQNGLVAAFHVDSTIKRGLMVEYLIRKGINCQHVDLATGRDPLQWACVLNRRSEVDILLTENKGETRYHWRDKYGKTALHYAVMRGNAEMVRTICREMVKYHLSVDVKDAEGFTPYLLAKRLGFNQCAEVLSAEFMASPLQMDDICQMDVSQWKEEGEKERRKLHSEGQTHKVALYKALGRLPELEKAKFDVKNINIVPSKFDTIFIKENLPERYRKLPHIRSADASLAEQKHKTDMLPLHPSVNKTLLNANYNPSLEMLTGRDSLYTSCPDLTEMQAVISGALRANRPLSLDSGNGNQHLQIFLDLLGHQVTHSFRHGAKKKISFKKKSHQIINMLMMKAKNKENVGGHDHHSKETKKDKETKDDTKKEKKADKEELKKDKDQKKDNPEKDGKEKKLKRKASQSHLGNKKTN